jgi:hypothetical protein
MLVGRGLEGICGRKRSISIHLSMIEQSPKSLSGMNPVSFVLLGMRRLNEIPGKVSHYIE